MHKVGRDRWNRLTANKPRVVFVWPGMKHHSADSRLLPPSPGPALSAGLVTTSNPLKLFLQGNFFFQLLCVCVFSLSLLSVPPFRGQTHMWVNSVRELQDISAATDAQSGCRKREKKNSLITITISDQNSAAALRRSWKRWQTRADKKEPQKGPKILFFFNPVTHHYCREKAADGAILYRIFFFLVSI